MLSVEDRVIHAIGVIVRDLEVRIDSTFEELNVDSLAAIEILFEVEEEFDIVITTEVIREMKSVRDVVAGVEQRLAGDTKIAP